MSLELAHEMTMSAAAYSYNLVLRTYCATLLLVGQSQENGGLAMQD